MTRICLCLLIALASATTAAAAREVKHSGANGPSDSCQESHEPSARAPASTAVPAATTPVRETEAKPSVHSDAPAGGQLQSPRWHSFLPGMFR